MKIRVVMIIMIGMFYCNLSRAQQFCVFTTGNPTKPSVNIIIVNGPFAKPPTQFPGYLISTPNPDEWVLYQEKSDGSTCVKPISGICQGAPYMLENLEFLNNKTLLPMLQRVFFPNQLSSGATQRYTHPIDYLYTGTLVPNPCIENRPGQVLEPVPQEQLVYEPIVLTPTERARIARLMAVGAVVGGTAVMIWNYLRLPIETAKPYWPLVFFAF